MKCNTPAKFFKLLFRSAEEWHYWHATVA